MKIENIKSAAMARATFFKAIRPLLISNKILGLICFKIHENEYKYSLLNVGINISLMIGYLTLTAHALYTRLVTSSTNLLVTTTDIMQVTAAAVQTIVSWGVSAVYQKKFITFLNRISNVDKKFHQLGVCIYYDSIYKKIAYRLTLHYLFVAVCVSAQIFIFDYAWSLNLLGFNITYYFPTLINMGVVQQLYNYNDLIRERYEILNEHLMELKKTADYQEAEISQIKLTKPLSTKLNILRIICPIHHELTKIAKIVNEAFGIMLLVSFGVSFITIIVCLYDASSHLQYFTIENIKPLCGAIAMCSTYVVDCLFLCRSCHATVETAHKSGRLLHQIDTDDMDVKDQIEMFSLQIVNEKLEYTAAGFFIIDYSLLFSIIGGITTYLIILIQFSANPNQ
ncbi:putative gustatory receptor 28b [Onthophagus taurus]|uniref:putative gustatory receptor 28b n=1 Tax=Onthophagus taurus TaxID=166361 RepID=UPI0039BDB89F